MKIFRKVQSLVDCCSNLSSDSSLERKRCKAFQPLLGHALTQCRNLMLKVRHVCKVQCTAQSQIKGEVGLLLCLLHFSWVVGPSSCVGVGWDGCLS